MGRRRDAARRRAATIGALGALLISSGAARPALGASSTDYPGPCSAEATATSIPATPLFLAADYYTRRRDFGFIIMPEVGRLRLGISCVATDFAVVRAGPDSALCTMRGRCTEADQTQATFDDLLAVQQVPGQLVFFHGCGKHGFGWYDAVSVQPGLYLAFASARADLFIGHGTMDANAFFGNGGQYQPVNCAPPGGGGGGGGWGGGGGGGGGCGGDYLCPEGPILY